MKKKLLGIAFLVSIISYAQGHYPEQYSVGVNVGATNNGTAYNLNVQRLIGQNYFGARLDGNYFSKKTNLTVIEKERVKHEIYTIGLAATYSLESIIPDPFYIQFYLGGHYSYENFNNGKNLSSYGVEYTTPNKNNYGFYGGTELEFRIIKGFSIVGLFQLQQNFTSDVEKYQYFLGGGLKYNF